MREEFIWTIFLRIFEDPNHFNTIPEGGIEDPSPELLSQAVDDKHMFSCQCKNIPRRPKIYYDDIQICLCPALLYN